MSSFKADKTKISALVLNIYDAVQDLQREMAAMQDIVASPASSFEYEDGTNLVSDFLVDSLIFNLRSLHRKGVYYHSIHRWRKPVKKIQVQALKSIKKNGSRNLQSKMAASMADAANSLYGHGTIKLVTNVPCGHGGSKCLIKKVAPLVAEQLGVKYISTFADLPCKGSSHPKTNLRRQRMTLTEKPCEPILLLDDVATSGRHIEEATNILKIYSPSVLPLVWVSD